MTDFTFLRKKKEKKMKKKEKERGDPLTDTVLTQWAFLDVKQRI